MTISFLLSSCGSTYYFSTLDTTTENTIKGDNGDFITGDDSLMVAYCFNGEGGPILIMIQNDGSQPLYVDWQRSSIIYKNKSTSYYNGSTGVSFIPPHSRIEYNTNRLGTPSFDTIPDKKYIETSLIKKDNLPANIKTMDFTVENTPFKFRSYLTLYTDPNHPFTFEQDFFVSNIMKSKDLTPSNMDEDLVNRGDLFYFEKESKGKNVGAAFLVGGLIVGVVALDVATSNNNDCCY